MKWMMVYAPENYLTTGGVAYRHARRERTFVRAPAPNLFNSHGCFQRICVAFLCAATA